MRIDRLRDVRQRFENITRNGTELALESRKITAGELAWICCVNERVNYMPDIEADEDGRIVRMNYNRVRAR